MFGEDLMQSENKEDKKPLYLNIMESSFLAVILQYPLSVPRFLTPHCRQNRLRCSGLILSTHLYTKHSVKSVKTKIFFLVSPLRSFSAARGPPAGDYSVLLLDGVFVLPAQSTAGSGPAS